MGAESVQAIYPTVSLNGRRNCSATLAGVFHQRSNERWSSPAYSAHAFDSLRRCCYCCCWCSCCSWREQVVVGRTLWEQNRSLNPREPSRSDAMRSLRIHRPHVMVSHGGSIVLSPVMFVLIRLSKICSGNLLECFQLRQPERYVRIESNRYGVNHRFQSDLQSALGP
jgi:hypothetical protein